MDSEADADSTGGDGGVEEHEDSDDDEEEDESESESENWSSDEDEDDRAALENLIRRLKTNDGTLTYVWAYTDVLRQICAAVQEDSNIFTFAMFENTGITIDLNTASIITTALARMPRLSTFSIEGCIEGCNIDLEAVSMLATYLRKKSSVRKIQWCGSNIGDKGAQVIAACFSGNNQIQEIMLPHNNIGNVGAIAIASLIESNDSIKSVFLASNKIGAEGARRLAQAIILNQSLEELYLCSNSQACSDAAANAFKTAIYNDESIETIISGSNHTIKYLLYSYDVEASIDLHRNGPEKARRTKVIRFLNEKPTSLLSTNLDETLMPSVLHKIGRDCLLNTMFELVRNMPDLLWNNRTRPNHQCRKRSRLS